MNDALVQSKLVDWIKSASKHVNRDVLTSSTPILEQRIITSLQVADLMLYIEELSEKPLDPELLQPGAFSTVDRICAVFFTGP